MARRRAEDPEARAKIVAAAEELFAERGFAGAAIRDIAAGAGVNGAMVHYYFGSKDGLYRSILESAATSVRALMEEAAAGPESTRERLTRFVEAYATYILTHPNLARILHREMLAGGRQLIEILRREPVNNHALMRGILEEGVRGGELRPVDLDLAPVSLMGMIIIFQIIRPVVAVVFGSDQYDERFIKRLTAHTMDIYFNGIRAPDEARPKKADKNPPAIARRRKQVKR